MSALQRAEQWRKQAIRRELVIAGLLAFPVLVLAVTALWRFAGLKAVLVLTVIAIGMLLWQAARIVARHDSRWLIRQLDKRVPELEDSSDLLMRSESELNRLQGLQQQRIRSRIERMTAPDLQRRWPKPALLMLWLFSLLSVAAIIFWPAPNFTAVTARGQTAPGTLPESAPVQLLATQLQVIAPAYTGLPVLSSTSLQTKFPEGSRLQWQLRFQPQPTSAELVFFDGHRLPLRKQGAAWAASRIMSESDVYRILVEGVPLAPGKWQRLDVIKDQPPVLRVLQPDRSLSLATAGQRNWALRFEAEDDYGLGAAEMQIQLAQGSGENIEFKSITRALIGQGSVTRKRFAVDLALSELGMQAGDDLIVQFRINDRRQPKANETRSASFILRWPLEDTVEATGVEGLLKKVMPAYFRSQRQIIIDTEKLLKQRSKLDAETFGIRSDTIGVDQRLLRLRYGQFLGEESEGVRSAAKPEADHDSESGADSEQQKHSADDGHDHGEDESKTKTVSAASQSILEQFGHTHDIAEAATLLDPETKKLLRAALNEMWQAELYLRTAEPKKALPYEYRALEFIKKVQQASRIYLAKTGNEQPPIDESRRLTGDRSGYVASKDGLTAATSDVAPLLAFWQALAGADMQPDFGALRQWLAKHPARVPDALGLKVALAELQSRPDCMDCLESVKILLWPVLPKVPAVPQSRNMPASDEAYRKALQQEREQ